MADVRSIRQYGDMLNVFMNDGKNFLAYPATSGHWIVTGVAGGGGTPGPGDGSMIDPLPGHYDSSDPFGSLAGGRTYPHTGSDWNGVPAGTDIPAISDGTVVFCGVEPTGGNGNVLCVQMASGVNPSPEFPAGTAIFWAFLHLNSVPSLSVGDHVTKGQIVAQVGDTGSNSIGAHLHVTLSDDERAYQGIGNKVDPYEFIQDRLAA